MIVIEKRVWSFLYLKWSTDEAPVEVAGRGGSFILKKLLLFNLLLFMIVNGIQDQFAHSGGPHLRLKDSPTQN